MYRFQKYKILFLAEIFLIWALAWLVNIYIVCYINYIGAFVTVRFVTVILQNLLITHFTLLIIWAKTFITKNLWLMWLCF